MKTRDELVAELRTLREEIRLTFTTAEHWSRTHPDEEPLDPDPDGELADMATQIDDILASDPGHGPLRTIQLRERRH